MRSDVTAYVAYGVQIPNRFHCVIEERLRDIGRRHGVSVGYLTGGPSDGDDLFLTTDFAEAELGEPVRINPAKFTEGDYETWNQLLAVALRELNIKGVAEPSWLLIADHD